MFTNCQGGVLPGLLSNRRDCLCHQRTAGGEIVDARLHNLEPSSKGAEGAVADKRETLNPHL